MNISSFMGGANFWGNAKEDSVFLPSSFDDGILEVSKDIDFIAFFWWLTVMTITLSISPTQGGGRLWLHSHGSIKDHESPAS